MHFANYIIILYMSENKGKQKNTSSKKISKFKQNYQLKNNMNKTLSGLSGSSLVANLVSVAFGVVIFIVAPYVVNQFGNTYAGAMLNIPPTGMIMALFIKEDEFEPFLKKLVWTPFFFVILNSIIYYLYFYCKWSALSTIYLSCGVWLTGFIIACFL